MAMKLCILLTSIISLGVMQKLALAVVGSEKPLHVMMLQMIACTLGASSCSLSSLRVK